MGVLAVLGDSKAVRAPNRWSRTPGSMIGYPWECRGLALRLLPTAAVCDQRLDASLRLLPTAAVCDQRLGASLRLLPTAGGGPHTTLQPRGGGGPGFAIIATQGEGGSEGLQCCTSN